MAGRLKGITIEIGGNTTGLDRALKGVNDGSRRLQSELREVNRQLRFDPHNTELLRQKQELLNESVGNTREKLETLRNAQSQVEEQFRSGKIGAEAYRAFQREVVQTENELQNLQREANTVGDSISHSLEGASEKIGAVGEKFTSAGKAFAPVSAAAGAAVAGSTKIFTGFDDAMRQVQATMGGSKKDFNKLSEAAQKMGSTTRYSATESAEALNYLALAGYDTDKAIATLPKVLNLAQAGGIDLAYASDMVTDSMSALGLKSEELDGFVDQLAKTSQKSNTSIGQLGEAILTVGGTAKVLSGGTVELNTALGLIADNGVKGAEGGTALRNIILSLTAPTSKAKAEMKALGIEVLDSAGNMRPLQEIMGDFNSKLGNLSEGQKAAVLNKIFNKNDLKSVNALLGTTTQRWDELTGLIKNSEGTAAEMAEIMESGIGGAFRDLKSAAEGMAIGIGNALAPLVRKLAEGLTFLAQKFNKLGKTQKQIIAGVLVFVASIAPVLLLVGKVLTTVSAILPMLAKVGPLLTKIGAGLKVLFGIIMANPVIAVIALVVAGLILLWTTNEDFRKAVITIWNQIKEAIGSAIEHILVFFKETIPNTFNAIIDFFKNNWKGILLLIVNPFAGAFKLLYDNCDGFRNKVDSIVSAVINTFKKLPSEMIAIGQNIVEGLWNGIKNASKWLKSKMNEFCNGIVSGIKDKFQIHSPSRVFAGIGENITQGLANGIKAGTGDVLNDMLKLQNGMLNIQTAVYPSKSGKKKEEANTQTIKGGDTYIFNSPKALTPAESRRQMQKEKRTEILTAY